MLESEILVSQYIFVRVFTMLRYTFAKEWFRWSLKRFEYSSLFHIKRENLIRKLCPSSSSTGENHTLTNPENVGATNIS
jgi:hypothetical protein